MKRSRLMIAGWLFALLAFGTTSGVAFCESEGSRIPLIAGVFGSKGSEMGPVARKIAEFKEKFAVGGADFSADGSELAINATFVGPDVHIWPWRDHPHVARVLPMIPPPGDGNAIRYSPDGTLLAVGHQLDTRQNGFGLIRIWNTRTGDVVHNIEEPQGAIDIMAISFSPDGKWFLRTVDRGGHLGSALIVHRTDSWEEAWSLPIGFLTTRALALSPDGQEAAVGGQLCELRTQMVCHPRILVVDLVGRKLLRTIESAFPDNNEIQSMDWSPDGKTIAAGAIVQGSFPGPDAVRLFDPTAGRQLAGERAEVAYVNGLSYSRDGRYLVEGYIDENVRIWDGQHNHLLQKIPVNTHFHTVLSLSRDSRYLAIAAGNDISVWELE